MDFLTENDTLGQNKENGTGAADPHKLSQQYQILGIILSISGSFLISISLNLQKYTHLRLARQQNPIPYYRSKLWWCGIIVMGIGELGNFAAYGFAPATLVAPLGCVSVIGSAAISVVFLKETLRASDVLDLRNNNILYLAVFIQEKASDSHCGFAAAGSTSRFLNQAMQLYNATEVVPINFVFFTTSAIFSGVIFYQEFKDAAVLSIFMFIFGCILSFLGVFLIARNQEKQTIQDPFINFGEIPGKETVDKIQPSSNSVSYGTVPN
uniref:NIPA like domain containing 2 n=1 Tax=Leptobrachium leishanense TaxID=445787 RepID=A0A8C5MRF6_9ANUR